MPTYRATGVTATLISCDLQSSLSNAFKFNQGVVQQENAKRVQSVFSSAQQLPERPIGEDGKANGVVRFVGPNEDMPLFMAEAGDLLSRNENDDLDAEMQDALEEDVTLTEYPLPLASSDGSPLTSLATSPTSTEHSFAHSPSKTAKPEWPSTHGTPTAALTSSNMQTLETMHRPGTPQALALDVHISEKSFLSYISSTNNGHKILAKGLKVEVFVNGRLADVTFVNEIEGRRLCVQMVDKHTVRFAGTRIHRQVEKPRIYCDPSSQPRASSTSDGDAEGRWNGVGTCLLEESEARGVNEFGDRPPSADFLTALAGVELPQRMQRCQGIGIIDLIITVGKGRKYGPDTTYLMQPTRLNDPEYKVQDISTPRFSVDSNVLETSISTNSINAAPVQRHTPNLIAPTTPSPNKIADMVKEFGLHIDTKKAVVGNYENAKRTPGKSGRTLRQRLGDLKKMTPGNMESELARLRDEFGAGGGARMKQKIGNELEAFILADGAQMADTTIDPAKLMKDAAGVNRPREDSVFADEANSASLLDGARSSPQETPRKRTRAGALANSPAHVAVKQPRLRGRHGHTPQQSMAGADDTSTVQQAPATQSLSGRGANRTAKKWDSKEQSVAEALESFEVPETCEGSCVSYDANPDVSRQIGKARGGEFYEEVLLVGMRFVVV